MDFKDSLKQLSERITKLKPNIPTEEATKNAFILPMLQILGYDVFSPLEVLPEMVCDIGTKKGEKIDYAIFKDGIPIILIECKHWQQALSLHDNQLLRYFHVSNAKFGILTNGIIYRFYTDLVEANKMDEKPFLEVDIENLKDPIIEELKKFHKSYFDVDYILNSATELKFTGELKIQLINEFNSPSPEFVKLLAKRVYDGVITTKLLDQFTILVKKSVANHINDIITERLNIAMKNESEQVKQEQATAQIEQQTEQAQENRIVTTDFEKEGYFIIKSILRRHVDPERITFRDAQTYFAIFLDDNNRKPICRLYLNSDTNKQFALIDDNKKEIRYKIQCIDELYNYSEEIVKSLLKYLEQK